MTKILTAVFVSSLLLVSCKSPTGNAGHQGSEKGRANHLVDENSPYLLQHAYNPVNWHPWGEEALAKAKAEDKFLIISIGYAACHWCHVMEHESFEDSTVARIMNEHFVSIKVDREERPDIDNIYMTACHLASGRSCGWPLNAFALPDGRPFWAGTYFPKSQWIDILNQFIEMKEKQPDKLEEFADQITAGIQQTETISAAKAGEAKFTEDEINVIAESFLKNIDFKTGGQKGSPKFPMPNNFEFLLAYHHWSKNPKALEAVTVTLNNMARGGIYDHLGGGFARYSTDAYWKVPHFEKMLYDNAQLVSLYSKAYQLTQNPLYKKVVEETLEFISSEMTAPNGGFYSSLDADSESEEGKYYVWTKAEIEEVIKDEKKRMLFNDYYEIRENGNWEDDKNILHRRKPVENLAKRHSVSTDELVEIVGEAKNKLFKARSKRTRPGLDDKILTSWNALMIEGYTDAYRAFGKPEYLKAALRNARFITDKMLQTDNRLFRNHKDGNSAINAFLDDYALTAEAFIALYQVTFDEKWLNKAKDLTEYALNHFHDEESGMFYYTSDLDPPLVSRKMELSDNVIPGSNSTMANNLYLVGLYFYNNEYKDMAAQMLFNLKENIVDRDQPNFYSNWCLLYLDLVNPPYEVAIVGEDYEELQKSILAAYTPDAIYLGGPSEGSLQLLKNKLVEGETMIYVCQNKVCKLPVKDVGKALALMK